MRPFLFKIEIIIYANLVFQILKYAPPDTFCYNRSVSENLINLTYRSKFDTMLCIILLLRDLAKSCFKN